MIMLKQTLHIIVEQSSVADNNKMPNIKILTQKEIIEIVEDAVETRTSTLEKAVDKLRIRLNDLERIINDK